MKVGNLSLGRSNQESIADCRIHAGKVIVLKFERGNEPNGIKATRHDAGKLIIRQVEELQTTITNTGIRRWHGTTQFIVVYHDELDAIERVGAFGPVEWQVARETIIGQVQVV